jgi:hypothetical protein
MRFELKVPNFPRFMVLHKISHWVRDSRTWRAHSSSSCDVRIRCDFHNLEEARGKSQRNVRVGPDVRMHYGVRGDVLLPCRVTMPCATAKRLIRVGPGPVMLVREVRDFSSKGELLQGSRPILPA